MNVCLLSFVEARCLFYLQEPKSPEGNAATPTPTAAAVDKRVVPKKVWSVSELKTSFMPLVNKMIHQEESIFLRQPVDPKALNIPVSEGSFPLAVMHSKCFINF